MDGCKLIIEYEVDCTFEFPKTDNGKGGIVMLDKEVEKGKIKILFFVMPDIYSAFINSRSIWIERAFLPRTLIF